MLFYQSAPHPALQKYIGQYNYVSFNTAVLPSLKQTFLPYDIPALSFFTGTEFLDDTKEQLSTKMPANGTSSGIAYLNAMTTVPTTLHFKGNALVKAFVIPFKPSGFWGLFRRNMTELTNEIPDFLALAGASEGTRFLEQLAEAEGFTNQVAVLDHFFLKRIPHRCWGGEQVREACRRLMISDGLMNMKELAYSTNMSMRTMERKFTEQVGVPPKLFARFKRFHHALHLMNRSTLLTWPQIAGNCGYYDQAHFIKEFNAFACQPPSAYNPLEYVLYHQIVLYRNFIAF